MPMADGPLGFYFGMFADKKGIKWMVNFDPKFDGQNYWLKKRKPATSLTFIWDDSNI
jgi:hypothetical protein